jgi:FtsZ-interacting cell division protein ZipA
MMGLLPNPYVILGAIITVIAMYFFGHHKGWVERDLEMQSEIAIKNEESRRIEQKLTEQVNATATKLQEANNAVTEKQSALDRAIRAGRVRISTPSCVQPAQSTAAPTGDRDQAGSKPNGPADQPSDAERATLAAIAEIVAQGDRNTQQLNACIDAYNTLRENMNGQR